jgi:transposase
MEVDFSKERSLTYLRAVAQLQHDELVRLREEIALLREKAGLASSLEEDNAVLKELLERREHALFARSSERRGASSVGKGGSSKPQTGHGPREQPELERVKMVHDVPENDRVCPCCGGEVEAFGSEVESSELISIRERAFVIEVHERKKYRCRCYGGVVTADGPKRLMRGGRYSVSFAIEVAIAKYSDHLPLERQVQIMRRDGLRIDSQTLWDQLDALAVHLQPTYEAIIQEILSNPVIHADETRWELLANGKTKENKTFQAWGLVAPELVAYRILDSRGKEAAATVLRDYAGVVMADAYTVYQSLAAEKKTFVVANCWAHVRRKFIECEGNFPTEASAALTLIRELYHFEREANDSNRGALRNEKSRPVVEQLMNWAEDTRKTVLPRSGIGEAIAYMLNIRQGLARFLDDPRIPIDNNRCERALRGVVLGRKNHYGSRSRRGTEVAAIIYTLMESAKLAGVSARDYLQAITELAIQNPGKALTPGAYKNSLLPVPP